jgi:carboxypeptidase Taq
MTNSLKDYDKLLALSKHARVLQGVISLLDWDQETYMPPGAAAIRSEQLKVMAGLVHRERTSHAYTHALSQLVDIETGKLIAKDLTAAQKAAIREWRRDYIHHTALPAQFVEEFAQVTSQAIVTWRLARNENSFLHFAPYLDRIIQLNRQKADYLGYEEHPYDALLDEYEPETKTSEVTQIFDQLRHSLTPLIKKLSHQVIDDHFLYGRWDANKQMAFSDKILEALGYDRDKGRLDFSAHPFSSSSHPTDSRITTRLHVDSLMSNIFIILHEGGHALYEMGLPEDLYGSPLGESRSLGVHESQSRWWETRIGLSLPFWHYFFPLLKETFKGQLEGVTFDKFYLAINKVKPSLIRVEADEVTYPLHVILRFEIERDLIGGTLKVRDVPEAWNAKMASYLGIIPENNREGCLQDIHWSMGAFGYFPTYTLGNLYAAHLFKGFEKSHPQWEQKVASGELRFVKNWLHENIYQHGKEFSTKELLHKATGHPFSTEPYVHYLKQKYTALYQL